MPAEEEIAWIVREFTDGRTQVDIGRELDYTAASICQKIKRFCDRWSGYDVYRLNAYGDERRQYARIALEKYGRRIVKPAGSTGVMFARYNPVSGRAAREYAWLLRAEGITYREIGERLGVSITRVQQYVREFSRYANRSMRRTRFKIYLGPTTDRDWLIVGTKRKNQ